MLCSTSEQVTSHQSAQARAANAATIDSVCVCERESERVLINQNRYFSISSKLV